MQADAFWVNKMLIFCRSMIYKSCKISVIISNGVIECLKNAIKHSPLSEYYCRTHDLQQGRLCDTDHGIRIGKSEPEWSGNIPGGLISLIFLDHQVFQIGIPHITDPVGNVRRAIQTGIWTHNPCLSVQVEFCGPLQDKKEFIGFMNMRGMGSEARPRHTQFNGPPINEILVCKPVCESCLGCSCLGRIEGIDAVIHGVGFVTFRGGKIPNGTIP